MYDFADVQSDHDALWSAVAKRLMAAGIAAVPPRLTRDIGFVESWRNPGLLLGQACEYPLAKSHGAFIRVVATPRYSASGCQGARYRSAIVVRNDDPAMSLHDLRRRRCAVNQMDSNSGMNLLRATIAPLAAGAQFFESVIVSGSHQRSAVLVAGGEADVAALDCVSYAHLRRADPALIGALRVIDWSPTSPSLPFITAKDTDDDTVRAIRTTLEAVIGDAALASVRQRLFLDGFDFNVDGSFVGVLRHETNAVQSGYAVLR